MANIPLKSIQFPGLNDTYTVPSNAGELPYNENGTYSESSIGGVASNLQSMFKALNIFNKNSTTKVTGKYTTPTGNVDVLASWCYLDVPVKAGEKYSCYSNGSRVMVCYFDNNGGVVSGGQDYNNGLNAVLTMPASTVVMRCSLAQANLDNVRIFESETLDTSYVPFGVAGPSDNFLVYSKAEADLAVQDKVEENIYHTEQNVSSNRNGIADILSGNGVTDVFYPKMEKLEYSSGSFIPSSNTLASEHLTDQTGKKYYYDNTNYNASVYFSDDGVTWSATGFVALPSPFLLESYSIHANYIRVLLRKKDSSDIESVTDGGLHTELSIANNISYRNGSEYIVTSADSLLESLIDCYAQGKTKVVVEAGTYDVIEEYEDYYGDDYFTSYVDEYNGHANGAFDRGLWLENIEIVFSTGAKVVANYTGNNAYVKKDFSAFACGNNVTIDGLVLDATNLRYGIHPDFNTGTSLTTFTVKNCDLHHYKASTENNQALGCGFGRHVRWVFENNIFRSDGENIVLRIHNNVNSDAQSQAIFKNCYIDGDGYFQFNAYSTSELQSTIEVCGCSYKTPPVVGRETPDSNDNFTLVSWNNELRS